MSFLVYIKFVSIDWMYTDIYSRPSTKGQSKQFSHAVIPHYVQKSQGDSTGPTFQHCQWLKPWNLAEENT